MHQPEAERPAGDAGRPGLRLVAARTGRGGERDAAGQGDRAVPGEALLDWDAAGELAEPGPGLVPNHVTAIGDSVMIDQEPDLQHDIPGIDVEATVSFQFYEGIGRVQDLRAQQAGVTTLTPPSACSG